MTSVHRRAAEIETAAETRARSLLADAEERVVRLRSEAAQQTERVSRQVDELMQLKDSLAQTMRGVLRDFGYVVERIERGEPVAPPAQPDVLAPPPLAVQSAPQQLDPAAAAVAPAPQAAASPAGDDELFDLRVEVDAGPFVDFTTLSAFERALTRLPKVEDVYVRRFAGDRAVIELTLSEATPLVRALREFLPYDLEVTASDRRRIGLNVLSFTPAEAR
jgi:hypothetical protein